MSKDTGSMPMATLPLSIMCNVTGDELWEIKRQRLCYVKPHREHFNQFVLPYNIGIGILLLLSTYLFPCCM
jgi:hypothetical protein